MEYDFELENAVEAIKREGARLVCIQLPDGLKPKAVEISMFLEEKTNAKVLIWMGSCFGACDIPMELKNLDIDLLMHFGHSPWPFWGEKIKLF
ncbi:MAG TPA: diphthamide synthesis protein [Candidatus Nanoarchaeia archaeon]|nr:diphthamide synthesis protein [Candidatus Nanoarchaeia archaeon]